MTGWIIVFAAVGAISLQLWLIFSLINDNRDLRKRVFRLEGDTDIITKEIGHTLKALNVEYVNRAAQIARIEREIVEGGPYIPADREPEGRLQ